MSSENAQSAQHSDSDRSQSSHPQGGGNRRGNSQRRSHNGGGRGRYDDRGKQRHGKGDQQRRHNNRRWDDSHTQDRDERDNRNQRDHNRDERRDDRRDGGNRGKRKGNGQGQTVRRGRVESESGRWRQRSYSPQRSGYREDRLNERANDPAVPDDIDVRDLDALVRQDLKVLSRDNANAVAKHLIMAATWMADDPELALRHARAAKHRAGRVAVVRESNGIAAYHAGEWKEALSELRAARRMSGSDDLIAVMADCERGLGRPERALELAREVDTRRLPREVKVELLIVVAGARRDLGQVDAAVTVLERANPQQDASDVAGIRLAYAYADALAARGHGDDRETAAQWFAAIAQHDLDGLTDAEDRAAELQQPAAGDAAEQE